MDTETFLVKRDRVMMRLADRRQSALDAAARHSHNGNIFGFSIPFWMRLAINALLPKGMGSFWPQALLTAVPVVLGLTKTVAGQFRGNSSSGITGFFPFVKSLIKTL